MPDATATPAGEPTGSAGARQVDELIRSLSDWRGEVLRRIRRLIREADPEITEACKWARPSNPAGVAVWSHDGIVCTGEPYARVVKLTFAHGASLPDPGGLFNASLTGAQRRAIDVHEGETLDAEAFRDLVRAAVAHNVRAKGAAGRRRPVRLLAGGNPQIPKGDGEGPVQAYISAMPGWKRDLGVRLDRLITESVPGVRKAVRWNQPLYGVEGRGWFVSFRCFTRYVKVTFFAGAHLRPPPPGGTPRSGDARWVDIHEGEALDEAQMADWVRQAAALPGWVP